MKTIYLPSLQTKWMFIGPGTRVSSFLTKTHFPAASRRKQLFPGSNFGPLQLIFRLDEDKTFPEAITTREPSNFDHRLCSAFFLFRILLSYKVFFGSKLSDFFDNNRMLSGPTMISQNCVFPRKMISI